MLRIVGNGVQRWALVAVALALAACDGGDTEGDPTGASSFSSRAPAGGGQQTKDGNASAGGEGAPTAGDSGKVKVEEGDVVRVVGDRMLILNQFRGLQVVDVKNPAKPTRLSGLPTAGVPREMYVDGERVVLIQSNAYEVKTGEGGKLVAWSGSRVVTASVDAAGKTAQLGAVELPGWIVHSRRIGDKVVVVTADTGWSPWYWGCYGPYGCVAEAGGVATGTKGSTATGSAGDAAVGVSYPGGGWGWNVSGGSVRVLQLPAQGAAKEVGAASFDGGVGLADFGTSEVLLVGQRSGWDDVKKQSWLEDTLTRVTIGADGKPSVAAKHSSKVTPDDKGGWSWIGGAGRVADGRLGVLRHHNTSQGQSVAIESWSPKGDTFAKTAGLSLKDVSLTASRFDDGRLLAVHLPISKGGGVGTDGKGDDDDKGGSGSGGSDSGSSGGSSGSGGGSSGGSGTPGSAPTPGGGVVETQLPTFSVFDLSDAATITSAGSVDFGKGWSPWGVGLQDLTDKTPGLWLLHGNGGDGQLFRTVQLDAKGKPTVVGDLAFAPAGSWSQQVEVLPSGLVLLGVVKDSAKTQLDVSVQLAQVDAAGKITLHGSYTPKVASWWQLASIEHGKVLLRASNVALETVDIADLAKPAALAHLEIAVDVWDLTYAGDRLVALTGGQDSWSGGQGATLRVLAAGSADDLAPTGAVAAKAGWGRLFGHGAHVYAVGYEGVEAFDVKDPAAPKAVGHWAAPAQDGSSKSWGWWSPHETIQAGSTLWLTWHQSAYVPDDPTCKGEVVVGGGSGGSSGSGGGTPGKEGSTPPPATDAGAAPDPADGGSSEPKDPGGEVPPDGGGGDSKPTEVPTSCPGKYVSTTWVRGLDLSDPAKPTLVGEVEIPGASWTQGATLVGKTLVLTHYEPKEGADDSWSGSYWLDRIDVSDIKAPKALPKVNVPGQVVALADDGKLVWTLDWQTSAGSKPEDGKIDNLLCSLKIVGNKAWLVKQVVLDGHAGSARKVGDHLYLGLWQPYWQVAAGKQPATTLQSWKLGSKGELTLHGSADLGVGASRIEAHDKWLFVGAGWSTGLMLFSVADAGKPTFDSWLPYQGWASQVVVGGGAVHLGGGMMGISRFELK